MENSKDKQDNKSILIVDDEIELLDFLETDLKKAGFQTFKASGGNDALKVISTENIDLVISDIRMPEGDGIFLLNSLKDKQSKIPVVFFVSAFSEITEDDALSLGAKALLKKPIDSTVLVSNITKVFDT